MKGAKSSMDTRDRCPYGFAVGREGKLVQAMCSRDKCRLWHPEWEECSAYTANSLQGDAAMATLDVMVLQKALLVAQLRSLGEDPEAILQAGAPQEDTPEDADDSTALHAEAPSEESAEE